jgi:GNAT superfamily N-acetyltransferase
MNPQSTIKSQSQNEILQVADPSIGSSMQIPEIGPLATSSIENKFTILYKLTETERRIKRIIDPAAGKKVQHKFWGTQPVPGFEEFVTEHGKIKAISPTERLSFKNTNGVSNYHWDDFTVAEFGEIYYTDTERYTCHSPDKTIAVWLAEHDTIKVGIRRTSSNKLVGTIIGRVITAIIEGAEKTMLEVGWFYVAELYRKREMGVYLINELRRIAIDRGIDVGIFSANYIVPTPTGSWSTCIRELRPELLTALIPVNPKESISEKTRTMELREEFRATGLRRATIEDASNIREFLESIATFDVWRTWTDAQIRLLCIDATCWIVEHEGVITDFVAWVDQEWHPREPWNANMPIVKVAQIILQAFGCDSQIAITCIITDLMIHAKNAGYHIFQTEKIGDSELYTSNLRFVEWGYPRYLNTYNYRIPSLGPKQIGFPVAWNV